MDGLMMDYPLTLQHFLERAGRLFPNQEIATRTALGMHRYRCHLNDKLAAE
jgi:fatty-acyl-CoA synthase